jgi:hypothetical protein
MYADIEIVSPRAPEDNPQVLHDIDVSDAVEDGLLGLHRVVSQAVWRIEEAFTECPYSLEVFIPPPARGRATEVLPQSLFPSRAPLRTTSAAPVPVAGPSGPAGPAGPAGSTGTDATRPAAALVEQPLMPPRRESFRRTIWSNISGWMGLSSDHAFQYWLTFLEVLQADGSLPKAHFRVSFLMPILSDDDVFEELLQGSKAHRKALKGLKLKPRCWSPAAHRVGATHVAAFESIEDALAHWRQHQDFARAVTPLQAAMWVLEFLERAEEEYEEALEQFLHGHDALKMLTALIDAAALPKAYLKQVAGLCVLQSPSKRTVSWNAIHLLLRVLACCTDKPAIMRATAHVLSTPWDHVQEYCPYRGLVDPRAGTVNKLQAQTMMWCLTRALQPCCWLPRKDAVRLGQPGTVWDMGTLLLGLPATVEDLLNFIVPTFGCLRDVTALKKVAAAGNTHTAWYRNFLFPGQTEPGQQQQQQQDASGPTPPSSDTVASVIATLRRVPAHDQLFIAALLQGLLPFQKELPMDVTWMLRLGLAAPAVVQLDVYQAIFQAHRGARQAAARTGDIDVAHEGAWIMQEFLEACWGAKPPPGPLTRPPYPAASPVSLALEAKRRTSICSDLSGLWTAAAGGEPIERVLPCHRHWRHRHEESALWVTMTAHSLQALYLSRCILRCRCPRDLCALLQEKEPDIQDYHGARKRSGLCVAACAIVLRLQHFCRHMRYADVGTSSTGSHAASDLCPACRALGNKAMDAFTQEMARVGETLLRTSWILLFWGNADLYSAISTIFPGPFDPKPEAGPLNHAFFPNTERDSARPDALMRHEPWFLEGILTYTRPLLAAAEEESHIYYLPWRELDVQVLWQLSCGHAFSPQEYYYLYTMQRRSNMPIGKTLRFCPVCEKAPRSLHRSPACLLGLLSSMRPKRAAVVVPPSRRRFRHQSGISVILSARPVPREAAREEGEDATTEEELVLEDSSDDAAAESDGGDAAAPIEDASGEAGAAEESSSHVYDFPQPSGVGAHEPASPWRSEFLQRLYRGTLDSPPFEFPRSSTESDGEDAGAAMTHLATVAAAFSPLPWADGEEDEMDMA